MIDFEKKCIICGNDLEIVEDKVSCPSCHFAEQNAVSKTDMTILAEAFEMLENKMFDSAYNAFGKFVKKHADLSVGYFGLVLSKYYVTKHSLEEVQVASIKNNCILNDVDYISAVKYADDNLRDYIMSVAKLIEEKSVSVVSSAIEYKPYEIAVLGDTEGDIYKYLDNIGYETYSNVETKNHDYLIDEFNVKSNAKMLVVSVNSMEELENISHNIIVAEYVNALNIQSVKPKSLVFVSSIGQKDIKKLFPEATILDADKKSMLLEVESVAKTCVREIVAKVDPVKSAKASTGDTSFNVQGFAGVFSALGIAGLAILLIEFVLYTFFGTHKVVLGVGMGIAGLIMIGTLALAIVLYLKSSHSTMYMLASVLSGVLILVCMTGILSVCFSSCGSEWCYRGYWYEENDDKTITITNVDYYYTFMHRDVVIPEKIMDKAVVHFTLQNHAEAYSVSSVSENLQSLTITNCSGLKDVIISVMSMEHNAVSISDCKNLKTISIKNAETLALELKNLGALNNFILKDVEEMDKLDLDNIGLDDMWLSEELIKLTNFDIRNMDSLNIYVLNKHEGNVRPVLTNKGKTRWDGNGHRHPNDGETSSKLYSRYVYQNANN